jgi:hypothetical protein
MGYVQKVLYLEDFRGLYHRRSKVEFQEYPKVLDNAIEDVIIPRDALLLEVVMYDTQCLVPIPMEVGVHE